MRVVSRASRIFREKYSCLARLGNAMGYIHISYTLLPIYYPGNAMGYIRMATLFFLFITQAMQWATFV